MSKDKNKSVLKLDIQDVIAQRFHVPHHNGPGLPSASAEQEVGVRCIDVPVSIEIRPGKSVIFKPGTPNGNIENIVATCTLVNDMLPDNLSARLPTKPSTVRVNADQWAHYVESDSMPAHWFLVHKEQQIFKSHVDIFWDEDTKTTIHAGTSWADAMDQVSKWMTSQELENNRPATCKKDYSSVVSPPSRRSGPEEGSAPADPHRVTDFLSTAKDILA